MSQENVEIVRDFFEQWGSEDWRDHIAEDIVWDTSASAFPTAGVHHGHSGLMEFFSSWLGAWDDLSVELLEIVDSGDFVFTSFRWQGRGRSSGAAVKRDFFGVYELRNGRVVRYRQTETRDEALADAGLRE